MERAQQRVGLAALVSLAVHALLFAWARQQPAAEPPNTAQPEPLAFVLIEREPPTQLERETSVDDVSPAPAGRTHAARARVRGTQAGTPEASGAAGHETSPTIGAEDSAVKQADDAPGPGPSGVADGVDLQLRPSAGAVPPAGLNMGGRPPPAPPSGPKLQPKPGGGYRYSSRGFQADIDRDGTVRFDDNLGTEFGGQRTGEPIREPTWRDRGDVTILSFDLSEAVMKSVGDDPFRVEKQSFMDDTASLRRDLCEADRKERLQDSLLDLNQTLAQIWADGRRSPAQRRHTLFLLWDECLEGPAAPGAGDAELVRTGEQARAVIVSFVQKNMPAGSPEAFPDGEIYALNAKRRSHEPFDPYGQVDGGAGCAN